MQVAWEAGVALLAVAAGAALVTLLVRRIEPLRWRTAAILLGMTFFYLGPALFTAGIPVPLDEVARGYPIHGLYPVEESLNPDANDTAKQMLPWMDLARRQIFSGEMPLWNPTSFSGYPLLGNAQSAPLNPLFLFTLWVPLPDQIVAMAGLKVFVALLFTFLLIRREGVADLAALTGAALFGFSLYISIFLYYPIGTAMVLVPLVCWAILRCLHDPTRPWFLAAALSTAVLQTAGHPETVLHAALITILLLLVEMFAPSGDARPGLRGWGIAAAAVGVGMLLSAPAWLPVLELAMASQRISEIGQGIVGAVTYPLNILWVLLTPNGYGHPVRDTYQWIGNYSMVAPSYLGLVALALVPGAIFSRSSTLRDRLLVVAGALLMLLAMNWTILGRSFSSAFDFVIHDRIRFGVALIVAIVVGRALDRIIRRKEAWFSVITALLLLGGLSWLWREMAGVTLEHRDLIAGLPLFALLAFILASRLEKRRVMRWSALSLLGLLVIEMSWYGWLYNPPVDRDLYAPDLPIIEAIERHAPEEPYRIVGLDWMLLPNSSAHWGLQDIRGSDPMAWGPYVEFFEPFDVDDGATNIQRVVDASAPQIDFLNVRYALAVPGWALGPSWELLYDGIDGMVWENREVLPRAYFPRSVTRTSSERVAEVTAAVGNFRERVVIAGETDEVLENGEWADPWTGEMGPTSYRLRFEPAEGARFVATSIPDYPGWRVEGRDGVLESDRINGAFVGFTLPAGEEAVRIHYAPASWTISLICAAIGVLLLVVPLRRLRRVGQV